MDSSNLLDNKRAREITEIVSETVMNLESLIDLSAKLNDSDDEEFILNSALLSLMGKLRVVRSCVLFIKDDTADVALYKGREPNFTEFSLSKLSSILNGTEEFEYDYNFSMVYKNEILGIICLGNQLGNDKIQKSEYRYAELLTQITANALHNARSHIKLIKEKQLTEKRNQLLTTLFEVARDFSNLLSNEQIMKMLLLHLMGQLMVARYAVLFEVADNTFRVLVNRFDANSTKKEITLSHTNFYTSNISNSDNPIELIKEFPEAEVVSPMIVLGRTRGLLIVGKSMNNIPLDDMNMHFIFALGNIAIYSLENNRLFQEELVKKSIEKELDYALEIQKNLMPKSVPSMNGYDLSGISIPSKHVGGDYYDFINLSETELLITIADVSGKGMPASLIMANVQAALRALAPLRLPLIELIERINHIIYENTSADKFITFFVGILDAANHSFKYINAGHNPPILVRNNTKSIELLNKGGLLLGCLDNPPSYSQGNITFNTGDLLLMYTDGITESQSIENIEYGEENLLDCLLKNINFSPSQIVDYIIADTIDYSANHQQYDDLTLVVLKRE